MLRDGSKYEHQTQHRHVRREMHSAAKKLVPGNFFYFQNKSFNLHDDRMPRVPPAHITKAGKNDGGETVFCTSLRLKTGLVIFAVLGAPDAEIGTVSRQTKPSLNKKRQQTS
jgi:hypothetical protein